MAIRHRSQSGMYGANEENTSLTTGDMKNQAASVGGGLVMTENNLKLYNNKVEHSNYSRFNVSKSLCCLLGTRFSSLFHCFASWTLCTRSAWWLSSQKSWCVHVLLPRGRVSSHGNLVQAKESPMHAALVFTLYYLGCLIGGRCTRMIGTHIGREHILTVGIASLFISSAVSVMAVNGRVHLRMMLFARALQGLGSAMIQAGITSCCSSMLLRRHPHPFVGLFLRQGH